MIKEVILPQLGQTMVEGMIIEWMVSEGERVERGDPLFSFESDKANLDVEAPVDGFVRKILVPAGETCPVLSIVAVLSSSMEEDISKILGKAAGEPISFEIAQEPLPGKVAVSEIMPAETLQLPDRIFASPRAKMMARKENVDLSAVRGTGSGGRIVERDIVGFLSSIPKVTPVAQRMAQEMGVDLFKVRGSGPGGKVTRQDVEQAHLDQRVLSVQPAPVVSPQPASTRPIADLIELAPPAAGILRTSPMAGLRKIIADRMSASAHSVARVTMITEVDATKFVEFRKNLVNLVGEEWGFRPGYNELLVMVVAKTLCEYPRMNAVLDGDVIKELDQVNIGLAVDAERGLKVVVVRNADQKGLRQLGSEIKELVSRALSDQSLPEELTGGTFTITNLGMFGVDGFTPIINPPETGILGVGRIVEKPAVVDGQICIRAMMTLSLSFDHRVIDGAPAARFLQQIARFVQEPALLLA